MKSDSKSKALWDAAKCVELAPDWSKGYNRLGAAQHGLGRFDDAIDSYKKGDLMNQEIMSVLLYECAFMRVSVHSCCERY